jgi:hypothetical protein
VSIQRRTQTSTGSIAAPKTAARSATAQASSSRSSRCSWLIRNLGLRSAIRVDGQIELSVELEYFGRVVSDVRSEDRFGEFGNGRREKE